ncbi:MAG: glutathione S-transferase family protein [Nannocystaceae bacterium]
MNTPTLVHLHYSPWSERARWALDHHAVAYATIAHEPVLGERRLRRLAGGQRPATVPLLLDGDARLRDSWSIAEYADRHGGAAPLLPAEHLPAIRRWNEVLEAAMAAGRGLVVAGLLADPAALDEQMPPAVPAWVRRLARPLNRFGTRWFAAKYGLDLREGEAHAAGLRRGLDAAREALPGESSYLVGGAFTYADIILASALQGVLPVEDRYIRMGPATRRAWTQPALAREYADLLEWRERLYRDHRGRRAS